MSDTPIDQDLSSGAQLEAARRAKLQKLIELGVDPWGGRFDDHQAIAAIRARESEIKLTKEFGLISYREWQIKTGNVPTKMKGFIEWLKKEKGTEPVDSDVIEDISSNSDPEDEVDEKYFDRYKDMHGPPVRAAGRLVLIRDTGKLIFANLKDWTGGIQLFLGKKQVGDAAWAIAQCFDLGDLIGVEGELKKTKTGELTIFVDKLVYLTKSLETPPDKHKGLTDPEMRQRMRYLDLTYTDGVWPRFHKRTKIVQSIRNTLAGQGFVEIEGPTLHTIAGGAAARPFKTHHNALDMPLFMRIALELHLKRLLVGGVERVYELGRVYRNEGISQRHNPEFTMLEVYQAYGDYRSMMDLTERLICDAIKASGQSLILPWGDKTLDFTPPFQRATYDELFAKHAGVDPQDHAAVKKLAEEIGFDTAGKHPDVIKSEVFEEKVEDALIGPIFVMDYPSSICPLTKRKAGHPEVAERFELFAYGMELANAYTELNDPDLQAQLFSQQLDGQKAEDSMAVMDHDFIRALRHGMPPAGGLGIGIDRLVMLLTNSQSIRDVILFPLLRHEV